MLVCPVLLNKHQGKISVLAKIRTKRQSNNQKPGMPSEKIHGETVRIHSQLLHSTKHRSMLHGHGQDCCSHPSVQQYPSNVTWHPCPFPLVVLSVTEKEADRVSYELWVYLLSFTVCLPSYGHAETLLKDACLSNHLLLTYLCPYI